MLIDGDGAKFADAFLQNTADGAPRAAQALKQAVRGYVQKEFPELDSDDIPILIRVYANLNGLAQSLRFSRVIDRDEDMKLFAEQLTSTRTDVDFVNVGRSVAPLHHSCTTDWLTSLAEQRKGECRLQDKKYVHQHLASSDAGQFKLCTIHY